MYSNHGDDSINTCFFDSQQHTYKGCELLTQHVPPLEKKLSDLDIQELGLYFREVRPLILISKDACEGS
jgi:hypothetical protein